VDVVRDATDAIEQRLRAGASSRRSYGEELRDGRRRIRRHRDEQDRAELRARCSRKLARWPALARRARARREFV
jgi:hypothetical protein